MRKCRKVSKDRQNEESSAEDSEKPHTDSELSSYHRRRLEVLKDQI